MLCASLPEAVTTMPDLTPEDRAQWRENAELRLTSKNHGNFNDRRILALLDALDDAERERDALRERLAAVEALIAQWPVHAAGQPLSQATEYRQAVTQCANAIRAALGSAPQLPTLLAEHGAKVLREFAEWWDDPANVKELTALAERHYQPDGPCMPSIVARLRAAALTEGGEDS